MRLLAGLLILAMVGCGGGRVADPGDPGRQAEVWKKRTLGHRAERPVPTLTKRDSV